MLVCADQFYLGRCTGPSLDVMVLFALFVASWFASADPFGETFRQYGGFSFGRLLAHDSSHSAQVSNWGYGKSNLLVSAQHLAYSHGHLPDYHVLQ